MEKFRDPVSGLTHLGAAAAALIGSGLLVLQNLHDSARWLPLLVYGICVVGLFSASATYHLVKTGPEATRRLRKWDHAAIYLLIAGTYTPLCLHFFTGFWREGLLAVIWGMALVGIVVKLFVINAPRWVTAGTYLVMGWMAVLAAGEMLRSMPAAAILWLALGGLFYTVGAVIYITKKMDFYPGVFGFHEVWHIFVILGALCHFVLIAAWVG